jgi:hypothetical protein
MGVTRNIPLILSRKLMNVSILSFFIGRVLNLAILKTLGEKNKNI